MTVDFSELHKILKDGTRRDILQCLKDKGPLTYVELMGLAKVTNTGRFNYHLKVLGSLIEKQNDGKYNVTERGRLAFQLLSEFPEKAVQTQGQKKKRKKLVAAAVLLLIGIIAVSSLLIIMQPTQSSFNVVYWKQQPDPSGNPNHLQYLFNVTGTHETFQLATYDKINPALAPLVNKYPFITMIGGDGTTIPAWTSEYVGNGQFTFTLPLTTPLTSAQLKTLTQDLKDALKSIQPS